MWGVCSPGGHQEGGGPAGTQAALPLSAPSPTGQSRTNHEGGEGCSPCRGRAGWVGVAVHGAKRQPSTHMERKKKEAGVLLDKQPTMIFCCWHTSSLNLAPYGFWGLKSEHVSE